MLTLFDIKKIINDSGIKAQFRVDDKDRWTSVVKQKKKVPTVYMQHFVEYNAVYFHSFSSSSIDISLILYHGKSPCAVWPLIFDSSNKEPIKSINNQYGGVIIPPLFIENFPKKSQRSVIKACINFLNRLLEVNCGECWRTNEVSTGKGMGQWHQLVLEKGGILDKVHYEMYLDLSLSVEEIRRFIRKSYRPLVSSGLKNWKVLVMDQFCEDTWKEFRSLHKRVAGRVTRTIETWNIQQEAIKSGDSFLVYISNSDGVMVGGGYFDMSSYECNYSVGSYDRRLFDQPLGHMIQYQAILTMKEKGREQYYLGSRFYKEELPFVTEKQVNIANFKQGFSSHLFSRVGLIFKR